MIKPKFYVMDRSNVNFLRQPHPYTPMEGVYQFSTLSEADAFRKEKKDFNLIILEEVKVEEESVPNRLI